MPSYCDCESYGNFDMVCGEEGTLWCPEQETCILECTRDCGCETVTTDPPTTSTDGNQEPTTSPEFESYCDQVCFGAEYGINGECCEATYCDCESYGNFPLDCNEAGTLYCPAQAACVTNCEADCGCSPGVF